MMLLLWPAMFGEATVTAPHGWCEMRPAVGYVVAVLTAWLCLVTCMFLTNTDRPGDSNKLHDVDPPFAAFDVGDDRVRSADPRRQCALRQARGLTGVDQHAHRRSIGWRGNPSPHDARLLAVRRPC